MKWSLCRWNKVCHNTLVIHQPALFNKQFRPSETRCSFWGMFVVGGFLFVCCLCFSFQTHRGLSKFWVNNDSLQCKSNCNNTNAVSEFPNNTSHLCHSWPFVKKKNLIHIHCPFVVFLWTLVSNCQIPPYCEKWAVRRASVWLVTMFLRVSPTSLCTKLWTMMINLLCSSHNYTFFLFFFWWPFQCVHVYHKATLCLPDVTFIINVLYLGTLVGIN